MPRCRQRVRTPAASTLTLSSSPPPPHPSPSILSCAQLVADTGTQLRTGFGLLHKWQKRRDARARTSSGGGGGGGGGDGGGGGGEDGDVTGEAAAVASAGRAALDVPPLIVKDRSGSRGGGRDEEADDVALSPK